MAPTPGPTGNPAAQPINYRGAVIPGSKKKNNRRSNRRSGRR